MRMLSSSTESRFSSEFEEEFMGWSSCWLLELRECDKLPSSGSRTISTCCLTKLINTWWEEGETQWIYDIVGVNYDMSFLFKIRIHKDNPKYWYDTLVIVRFKRLFLNLFLSSYDKKNHGLLPPYTLKYHSCNNLTTNTRIYNTEMCALSHWPLGDLNLILGR